jgi:electron transport complex protein RnfB
MIPNGFPATESGVELRLLAKIFEPEEAELASVMRVKFEPAAEIAARAGAEPAEAKRTLRAMVRKGQIGLRKGEGELLFALMPFIVGIYEEQLSRLDRELAQLFEQYFEEALGGPVFTEHPPLQRVIPVEEAISVEIDVHPYEQASQIVESAKAWGVRDCICRTQQRLVGKGCERLVSSCLILAPVPGAFDGSSVTKAITKEESLRLLREAEEAGLVHTTGNYQDSTYYICNCCSCCCGVLRGLANHPTPNAVVRSDFVATVEAESCTGCGDCVERCPISARSLGEDGVCSVDQSRCIGCGLCASSCTVGSISLQRRTEVSQQPPVTLEDWMAERASGRGLPPSDDY